MTNDSCPLRFVIWDGQEKPAGADQTTLSMSHLSSVVREGNTAAYRNGLGAFGSYPQSAEGKKETVWQTHNLMLCVDMKDGRGCIKKGPW